MLTGPSYEERRAVSADVAVDWSSYEERRAVSAEVASGEQPHL
jgi:hypothetical protein